MFPLGDDNSDRTIQPYVNYIFIGANILVFIFLQGLGGNEKFTYAFSLVPQEIMNGIDLNGAVDIKNSAGKLLGQIQHYNTPFPVYFNFVSSMFMHGDFMHLFGNMLFLFIFGDNLENLMGHMRYAIFYVICGFIAAFSQIFMDTSSVIPMLGASGAISGVLGGYLMLFSKRGGRALIFNFMTTVPAYVALGIWIGFQIIQGYLSDQTGGGVAYAAHIGGFVAGLLLVRIFTIGRQL